MKNLKLIFIFCCIASIYFTSCYCDCCNTKLNCGANGTCLDGLCSCSEGYEGNVCDTLSSTKFIGHWKGQEIYYRNNIAIDTAQIDWTANGTSEPSKLKITTLNSEIIIFKPNKNKLTIAKTTDLNIAHIINSGTANFDKVSNTINYQFAYNAVDSIPAFYGRGVLVKVP